MFLSGAVGSQPKDRTRKRKTLPFGRFRSIRRHEASIEEKENRKGGIYLCDAGRVCCSIVGIYQSSVEKVVDHLVIGVEYGNDAIISFKIMISPPQSLNACRNVICCKPTWNCEILLFLLVAADTFLVFFIG